MFFTAVPTLVLAQDAAKALESYRFDLDPKGNEMAKKVFQASKKETGQLFKIQGVFKRNELRVSNIAEVAK
ncbi:MAG: hypothetical protein IPL73_20120 [Candidatus Obscuribacter sp.]|nr:hypothetical protein [Candidatus Obscuribacter sp.]